MNQSNQDNGTIQKDATRLDRIVDAFEEAWRAGNRPDIDWYLPADVSLRQLALIKLVHIDLENRFRSGEKVRVETYLDIYPEIAGDTGVELVAWEVALRRRDEPDLRPEEYRRRLPQYADRIDAVFAATDSFFNKKKLSIPPETVDEVSVRSPSRVSSLTPQPAAGTATVQIPGYEILGLLGRGGMGIVFKARHAKLQRLVALKMMLAGSHADEKDLGRFRTEAEAVARLQHPNIVQIHDIGEHEGKPYFSLEFCAGGSLNKKLDGTPLQPMEAAKLIETLARAIHAAHQQHVTHRDLKPANVLLTEDGTPKITDFGLAKKLDDVGQTQSGAVMGTPSYMAPEQASGKTGEIGATTDVYALGAILYELLTGRTPFRAATPLDTVLLVLSADPVAPRKLNPKIPRDLETICMKCLEKQPGKRFADAAALAEDLRRYQAGEPISARPVSALTKAMKWARRRPAQAVAALVSAVAATVLLIGGLLFTEQLHTAWGEEKKRAIEVTESLRKTEAAELNLQQQAVILKSEKKIALEQRQKAELLAEKERTLAENNKLLAEKESKARQESDLARKDADNKRQQALEEKQIAQAVRAFLQDNLLRQANPWEQANQARGANAKSLPVQHDITVCELLDRGSREFSPEVIETKFPNQPQVQAEVLETIGESYQSLGEDAKAIAFVKAAYMVREKALGPNHPVTLSSMTNLVFVYVVASRQTEAAKLAVKILERLETSLTTSSTPRKPAQTGSLDSAEDAMDSVIQTARRRLDLKRFYYPEVTLTTDSALAWFQVAVALPRIERIAGFTESRFGKADPRTCFVRMMLGFSYHAVGQVPKALKVYEDVLTQAEHILPPDDVFLVGLRQVLAITYQNQGVKRQEAVSLQEKICETLKRTLGPEHPTTVSSWVFLARYYQEAGKVELAQPLRENVFKVYKAQLGPDHPITLENMHNLAYFYYETGKLDLALSLYEESLKLFKAKLGPSHFHTLLTMQHLGQAYDQAGKRNLALPLFEETLKLWKAGNDPSNPNSLTTMAWLGEFYRDAGRLSEAIPLLEEADKKGRQYASLQWVEAKLFDAYIRAGKKSEVTALMLDRLKEARTKLPPPRSPARRRSVGPRAHDAQAPGLLGSRKTAA